jgi:hypothetical protein
MRATSTVVVMSSLLLAASVAAGPNDKAPATTGSAATKSAAGKATASSTGPAAASSPAGNAPGDTAGSAAPAGDVVAVKPEDMPTSVRMRRLEQQTQALKERAWQLKARVQMLKEQMLGGGVGAQAVINHASEMGASFRLIRLIYTLDGTQVFVRTDDSAESLYKSRGFDVFAGPISPGNHNLTAQATYRGHGYGVFEYLSKYTFTARGQQAFAAAEGKIAKVDCKGFEKGGPTTPLEKRAAIECVVVQVQPEKPADTAPAPAAATPPGPPASAPVPGAPAPGAPAPAPAASTQPGK